VQRQLPLQIRDLLLFLGELLSLIGQLLMQLLNFPAQTFVFASQRLAIRRWTPLGARSSMRGTQRLLNI
jgi:hypothetical protein